MDTEKKVMPQPDTDDEIQQIAKYDPEFRFRQLSGFAMRLAFVMTLILSIFHIYTAGFGVLQEWRHRAFHLAFVLPLVFFYYSIRKEGTDTGKHLVYDILYGIFGSALFASIFREVLDLNPFTTTLMGCLVFFFIFYFKRRVFLKHHLFVYLDFVIFTGMGAALVYGGYLSAHFIHFSEVFRDPNPTLLFWSVLLFGIFVTITLLFFTQWARSFYAIIRRGKLRYDPDHLPYFDAVYALLACAVSLYIFLEFNSLVFRAGLPLPTDLIVGGFAILLVLEGARRSIGPPLPIIAIIVLINCYLGPYFLDVPGLSFFAHRGYSIDRIIEHMYLGTEGIFGIPLGVVATFVFHFVLFGIFISKTGLGQLFIDLAMALAGGTVGGPAKVSVISSGFLGSINGSSIANTVTTGAFTIPLMKRVGYAPRFAGAVEAAASTGGQLMPPIMGAAAFIMAEFLSIPYIKIAAAAIIPSFLHFFAVGTMVHFEALKQGLMGLPKEALPRVSEVLKERGLLVMPLLVIVFLLISGSSPFLAAFWGIIYSVAVGQIHRRTVPFLIPVLLSVPSVLVRLDPFHYSPLVMVIWAGLGLSGFLYLFRKTDLMTWLLGVLATALLSVLLLCGIEASLCAFWANMAVIGAGVFYSDSRMKIPDILNTLELGTKNALAIGAACACVGFIVGATTLTGLGLKFAAAVIELARGVAIFINSIDILHLITLQGTTLFFTLVFTAISCFILGMGIPTTAQYIIASMIAAPALLEWGIHPLVSHMFVLFYAVLADVTPPVALAAYAASGISGGDPFRTGFTAFSLSLAKVYVPFAFVYSPIILWLPRLLDPSAPFDFTHFAFIVGTLVLGVIALGATIIGYFRDKSTRPERLITGIATICLFSNAPNLNIAGFCMLALVYLLQRRRKKKN
ncbi:MAG: TRAP transporter permease [Deltaproteobacteria bacterium]|nr:TRAP transporter permease [Deltaproteobacteria bacterium]